MSTVTDDDLILKFRGLFPDKLRRELKNIFIDMTKSVYKNVGKDEKMTEVARNRWGAPAASLRSLNLIEFKIAMYRFKSAGLTFEEIRRVFIHLDTSGNGRVEYDEFLAGIRGELSMFRQRLVIYIFRKLDRNSSGFIEESELAKFYKSSNLPEILDGAITPKAKSKDFVNNIGTPATSSGQEGRISVDQFIDYYLSKSLIFTGTDEEFRAEVLSEWRVESDSYDGNAAAPISPLHDGKSPAPPSSLAPSSSQQASPRSKKTVQVSLEEVILEPEEYDAQYRQMYPIPTMQAQLSPRRASLESDSNARGLLQSSLSPHQQRFSPPVLQPQPRLVAAREPQVRSDQPGLLLETPQTPSSRQLQQQQQQQQQQHFQMAQQMYAGTPRTTDQIISDNLNSLTVALQQKVFEQQQTIESQHQVMATQQQMLTQLQVLLEQQRH